MLSRRVLMKMLENSPPLVEGLLNKEKQVQQTGIDFTLSAVMRFKTGGQVDFDNSERKLPEMEEVLPNGEWFTLSQGAYKVRFNEIVHIPTNLMGIARPRSTLLRCGATMNTALWDPGYEGRSESMMTVMNPNGIRLKKNAKIMQMVFLTLQEATESYSGKYQRENI
jgi:dUTP pyrophosphatase